jgi:hypothetical protein
MENPGLSLFHPGLSLQVDAVNQQVRFLTLRCYVDFNVFGPPGSGSVSQRPEARSGFFLFLINVLSGLK